MTVTRQRHRRGLLLGLLLLGAAQATVLAQEPVAQPAGEPPLWTFGCKFPQDLVEAWKDPRATKATAGPQADVLGWAPPGVQRLRGVLLFANNTDLVKIGEHKAVREVAARRGIGILYLRELSGNAIERVEPPDLAERSFAAILDQAATASGIADFRHAPWITLGKSSRGRLPFRATWWFPERVVASISYHGEGPTWPMPAWSKAGRGESVLHLNIQGLSEWDGTWYRHVRPGLLNYNRQTGWLAHQAVIYGVDHGYYMDYFLYPNFGATLEKNHRFIRVTQVWDYIALFIDKAMGLRVPEDASAAAGPIALRTVGRDTGYLIHPRAPEELLGTKWFALRRDPQSGYQTIPWPQEPTPVLEPQQGTIPLDQLVRLAAAVPEAERGDAMWIPDRELLGAWLKLHNLYQLADRVPVPGAPAPAAPAPAAP